jgi:uncharacterized membrane protein YhaH (DUF805 family)
MESSVQLVFAGEVLEGFSAADVRRRLGELLKLDETRLAALFSGSQVVIKRGLKPELAAHWVAQFKTMGAMLHAQQVVATPPPAPLSPPLPAMPMRDPGAPSLSPIVVNTLPPSEEISCPNCGERQPKRILCRSCAADMPRGIAAREEAAAEERARQREESLARRGIRAPGTPAARRGARPVDAGSADDAPLFGMSFAGRIGRMRNFLGGLIVMTLMLWLLILAVLMPAKLTFSLLILGFAFALVWGCRLTALRLHDIGHSAWWMVLFFVPYVGAIGSLALALWPSDEDANEHGSPPAQDGSMPAIGMLVALCLSIALGWSMAWSSLQRQMHEFGSEEAEAAQREADDEPALPRAELARVLHSDAAVDEFRRYIGAPGHKAFTVSTGGAWGWHAGAARPDQAIETALADCERRRAPYTAGCRLVHVNDQWAMN